MQRPAHLPHHPGCYLFWARTGGAERPLYVGKATDLARRVSGYFGPRPRGRPRLVAAAASLQLILTRNPHEAAVLERNLIRRWRPRYNRAIPDENTGFWYLQQRITADGRFPTFQRYRPTDDAPVPAASHHVVFGPYLSYAAAEAILGYVTDRYRLRTCSVFGVRRCARFDMGACLPVCDTPALEEQHARQYEEAVRFLQQPASGPAAADQLRRLMGRAAERGDFEAAGRLRDRARLLEQSLQTQAADIPGGDDCDVVAGAITMVVKAGRVEEIRPATAEDALGTSRAGQPTPTPGQMELARLNARHGAPAAPS